MDIHISVYFHAFYFYIDIHILTCGIFALSVMLTRTICKSANVCRFIKPLITVKLIHDFALTLKAPLSSCALKWRCDKTRRNGRNPTLCVRLPFTHQHMNMKAQQHKPKFVDGNKSERYLCGNT